MDIDFEKEQTTDHIDWWADKVLDIFLLDPRHHTAWKFWRASHPVNMGDALRFSVNGSKHSGYVTVRYGGGCDTGYEVFDVELGVREGTAYRCTEVIERVHVTELVRTISLKVL